MAHLLAGAAASLIDRCRGQVSRPEVLLNTGVAAADVALGCDAILALAYRAPERRR